MPTLTGDKHVSIYFFPHKPLFFHLWTENARAYFVRHQSSSSRKTPENTMISQSYNTPDPEMAQEYIYHVSEEIEGRVTRKLSKEFSRTESRILGALSKLDEFLLNPQIRTCSVAVPGTSRNSGSENREPTGNRSIGHPSPEAVFSTYHSTNLKDPEQEETHHIVTGVQE